jgi:hypothetical protein
MYIPRFRSGFPGVAMSETETHQLPIQEDMLFQRRNWVAERVMWSVMTVGVAAAILGLFSRGPLSDGRIADGRTFTVEYEAYAHKTARTNFTVRTAHATIPESIVRLSRSFLDSYDIEFVHPHPVRAASGDSLVMVFAPTIDGNLIVQIGARPRRFGRASLAVGIDGQGRTGFTQLIYP